MASKEINSLVIENKTIFIYLYKSNYIIRYMENNDR